MRRFTVLLVGAGMAALMLAVVGMAWAVDYNSTPPTIISTNPADNATGVDVDANIKAKFSEKMMGSSVKAVGAFRLYEGNLTAAQVDIPCNFSCGILTPQSASVSYNKRKKLAILNPSAKLYANTTTYTVVVEGAGDSDSLAVKDRAGNPMATDYVWHFTTGAN